MGLEMFKDFQVQVQNETDWDSDDLMEAMIQVASRSKCHRKSEQPHLLLTDFVDYLFSPQNSALDRKLVDQLQDMNQPLSQYFINSSHNTYLTGL